MAARHVEAPPGWRDKADGAAASGLPCPSYPPHAAMLLFLPTPHVHVPPEGLADGGPFRPLPTLDAARAAARQPDGQLQRILVLEGDALTLDADGAVGKVPHAAVLNVDDDYWRPEPVEAGGGYVVRRSERGLEVLMIFRRGVWDLPKGKLDDGETQREAAVREVAEEVGIDEGSIRVLAELPPTVHGYVWPKRAVYAVKTTHWYAMETSAETFEPEAREGIEAVDYVPWAQAGAQLGYESLRRHLGAIDPDALGV